jgi:hypothetical protein
MRQSNPLRAQPLHNCSHLHITLKYGPGVGLMGASGVLEKLTVPQLVKKFPVFYAIRSFITVFSKVC